MNESMEQRLERIKDRIEAACIRSGRDSSSLLLVAVSKTYPPEAVDMLARLGCRVFGESRVQEAAQKIPLCASGLDWHGIGHLQRNKAAMAVALFSRLHSIDTVRLLEKVESCAASAGRNVHACLEVNVSGESSKYGFAPDEVPGVLEVLPRLRYVQVDGLMTIAPFAQDPEDSRVHFRRLRELRDKWVREVGWPLKELSMGMSGDMEVAIEEGATMVRVGTALFGPRPKPGGSV